MSTLIDKLSEYELLNNLIPGVLLYYLINRFTPFNISLGNEGVNYIIYYIVGLIIGRVGSVILEPLFRKGNELDDSDFEKLIDAKSKDEQNEILQNRPFAIFAPYNYFIGAEKDKKLAILSSKNNLYRSLAAVFLCFSIVKIYAIWIYPIFPRSNNWILIIGSISLAIIFCFSYRKQTDYVRNRVLKIFREERKQKRQNET